MRVSKTEAIAGGVSDPRNGVILKIFSLINYGERAGSGLNSIFNVWNHVYHTPATISEEVGVDRVIVTLPYGGNEQDVKAMLELYDNPEELMFPEGEQDCYISTDSNGDDKVPTNIGSDDKVPIKRVIADKVPIISQESADKLADIIIYLGNHTNSKSNSIAQLLGVGETSSKKYLRKLIELGFVVAYGANKNRTYSLTQEILMSIRREKQS